jgi:hypothetical protein
MVVAFCHVSSPSCDRGNAREGRDRINETDETRPKRLDKTQDTRHKTQNTKHKTQDTRDKIEGQDTTDKEQDTTDAEGIGGEVGQREFRRENLCKEGKMCGQGGQN